MRRLTIELSKLINHSSKIRSESFSGFFNDARWYIIIISCSYCVGNAPERICISANRHSFVNGIEQVLIDEPMQFIPPKFHDAVDAEVEVSIVELKKLA